MMRLIKIEWLKFRKSTSFWVLLSFYAIAIYVACSLGTVLLNATFNFTVEGNIPMPDVGDLPNLNIYEFPGSWHNLTYLSSYVKIFLGILMITSISNEITHKTMRQNIIDGMSEMEFLVSKYGLIGLLSLVSTVLVVFTILYFGTTYGYENSPEPDLQKADFILGHFVQILTFLSFAVFISLLMKSGALAIVFTIAWTFFLENFLAWIILDEDSWIRDILPVHAIDNIVRIPFSLTDQTSIQQSVEPWQLVIALLWACFFFGASYILLLKRDL